MKAEGLHNPIGQMRIRVKCAYNLPLAQRARIDLGGISGENLSDGLIRPTQKLAKSVIKSSSKVHELKTYDKAINNLINGNR